jgi:hypothetical protein
MLYVLYFIVREELIGGGGIMTMKEFFRGANSSSSSSQFSKQDKPTPDREKTKKNKLNTPSLDLRK